MRACLGIALCPLSQPVGDVEHSPSQRLRMRWRRLLPPPPCPARQCGAAVLGILEDPESAVAVAGQDVLLTGLWVGPDLHAPEVVAAGWGDSTDRVDVAADLDQLTVHDPDGSKPASVVGEV